jgi:2'-5' RNA ligase superfamily
VISISLEHVSDDLSLAHRDLYPERIPEQIPFSITLLFPWLPAPAVTQDDLERLRSFFAARPPLEFALTSVAEFPDAVAYAVPEPDDNLRETMQALWALYPQCPPYGKPGSTPSPHATLTRYANPINATFEQAKARVERFLPVDCVVHEAILLEEYELDRLRTAETFTFGG